MWNILSYSLNVLLFSVFFFPLHSETMPFDFSDSYKISSERLAKLKKMMPTYMRKYYYARKRFIDRQPISEEFFMNQIEIILQGSYLRKSNQKNLKEIKKLENFLLKADDFQLARYFQKESYYLSISAKQSIQEIKELAKLDENWRKKSDPVFFSYLENQANIEERKFYKRNKYKFFSDKSGQELVEMLKIESNFALMD